MNFDFTKLDEHITKTIKWLKTEFSQISTGRISPSLLDSIQVSSYGTKQSIKAVASISAENARTLRITPWDADSTTNIETAIKESGLPVSMATDSSGIRVTIPELTEETREKLKKVLGKKLEEAKVSLRNERKETGKEIEKAEKDGDFAEDDKKRFKEELDSKVKNTEKELDELYKVKEESITTI